jgi:hypothetical protein
MPTMLHELDEQHHDGHEQADEKRREQPAGAEDPMLESRFDLVHAL